MREERAAELGRQIEDRLSMLPGHEETVPREQGTMIEERQEISVLEDHVSTELTRGDPAEGALSRGHRRLLPWRSGAVKQLA